jgi:hypothetical protein
MGVILYNNPPQPQLLRNSSFEEPLSALRTVGNWYFTGDVTRQTEVVAFGGFAAKMVGPASLVQESEDLARTGSTTIGVLVRSEASSQEGKLSFKFELLDGVGNVLFEDSRSLKAPTSTGFSIVYVTVNTPTIAGAFLGKVTYSVEANGTYFLDNGKAQAGVFPTQWTPFPGGGEPDIPDIPTTYSIPNDEVQDPILAAGGATINLSSIFNTQQTSGQKNSARKAAEDAGDTPIGGGDTEECVREYKEFLEAYKKIVEKELEFAVNRKEPSFFPTEAEKKILEFKRQELAKCLGEVKKITSVQKGWLRYAKNKIAAVNRSYERRNQARKDRYALKFISGVLTSYYLVREAELVRKLIEE